MFAFAFAVFLLIVTPGPGVLSAAGIGAAFGARPALFYIAGLWIGTNIVSLAVISGLVAVLFAEPLLRMILLIGSAFYLLSLAFRIASAGRGLHFQKATSAPGLRAGLFLQFINPKAYAVALTLFSGFAFAPDNFLFETSAKMVIYNLIWVPLHLGWLFLGLKLHALNLPPEKQRLINYVMAAALTGVVLLSLSSLIG